MEHELFAGRYRLGRELGRGGMGVVSEAYDERMRRRVALKRMRSDARSDPATRRRFLREARTTAAVDHPHVITVHDVSEEEFDPPYITMALLEGGDLAARLPGEHRLDLADVVLIAEQVGAGLDAAHARGLVHRDVKPANVLFTSSGPDARAVVCDFGLAKPVDGSADLTSSGLAVGTANYMAPEQVEGVPSSPQTDVYALGCVLFRCLAGRPPYVGETMHQIAFARLTGPPPDVRDLRPDLPAGVAEVLARALARDPADRWRSAGELARGLSTAAAGAGGSLPPEQPDVTWIDDAGIDDAGIDDAGIDDAVIDDAVVDGAGVDDATSRIRSRGRGRVLVYAGAAGLAVAAVVGLTAAARDEDPPDARPTTASPAPTTPPLTAAEQALLARLPETLFVGCASHPTTDAGQTAALTCESAVVGADEILARQWVDSRTMTADFRSSYQRTYADGKCSTFQAGPQDVGVGVSSTWGARNAPLACYVNDNGDAVIMWEHLDDAVQLLGVRDDADTRALYRWWEQATSSDLR